MPIQRSPQGPEARSLNDTQIKRHFFIGKWKAQTLLLRNINACHVGNNGPLCSGGNTEISCNHTHLITRKYRCQYRDHRKVQKLSLIPIRRCRRPLTCRTGMLPHYYYSILMLATSSISVHFSVAAIPRYRAITRI